MKNFEKPLYIVVGSLLAVVGFWMMAVGAKQYSLWEPVLLLAGGLLTHRGLRK